ncbi:tetratricopeptide repeat-containing sulfotransferase family protein [Microbulbifer hydrolyticus]|uniref:Tetratricopeptide (TPR) repeat protein n=1 Tax=Microbulbifer hydrolyticus TaxID=48074 RepID=A0A6P1TEC6_9GAMM|nr:tetratricopeptide repeat-containing sulfotransferase family protein [Microbulbifer hydrolyticus]MBB5212354.1 tetratricopeptide (TPR) repeat protein [Microbulbifer hydrolyticus]QHQ39996.1 tetratricopeptide repeat protein [Microbulbifer hydrolyticus]
MNQPDLFESAKRAIKSGNLGEAEKLLRDNLGNQAQFEVTRLMLAEILIQRGDSNSAQSLLLDVVEKTPGNPHSHILLAHISRLKENRPQARKHLQAALKSSSLTQENLKFIADECVAIEDFHTAIHVLNHVNPMDGKSFHNLGYSYFRIGETGKALPIYRKLFASYPKNPRIARELSLAAAAFREYDTAVEAYEAYMRNIQPSAADYLKFADLELMNHNVEKSERHLQKSISLGENSAAAKLLLARISRLKGDYPLALNLATEVTQASPGTGTAWSLIAELTHKEAVDSQLIASLESALTLPEISPEDLELSQFALADLYIKAGDFPTAYHYMHAANRTKAAQLKRQGTQYNPDLAEQHFNELKSAFTDSSDLCNSECSHRPVFVVGMPRSGTTMINRVLDASGKFNCIGESEALPYIFAQTRRTGGPLRDYLTQASSETWNNAANEYLRRIKHSDRPSVDKMPSNFLYVGYILSMFPHARIIQMRRNPFDVCLSIFSKPFPEGHNYACSPNDVAHYYYQANSLMDFWSQKFPENIFEIDFDQFLEKPNAIGKELYEFLNEDWSEDNLLPPENSTQAFTFSEIQVRRKISRQESMKWQPFKKVANDLMDAIKLQAKQSK